VQGGLHGGVAAAPIARDIIRAYYQQKSGSKPQYTEAGQPANLQAARTKEH
jgi:hypothetical protein